MQRAPDSASICVGNVLCSMRSDALFVPDSGIDATELHRVEPHDLLQGRVGPLNLEILLVISSGVVHSDSFAYGGLRCEWGREGRLGYMRAFL